MGHKLCNKKAHLFLGMNSEGHHLVPVHTCEVAALVWLLCYPCRPVSSITGIPLLQVGRASELLSFTSMQPPWISRSIAVATVTSWPACGTFLSADCVLSSCLNAWGQLGLGERVRERGVSVRLFNLFRLDDFMSLSPLGLMGENDQLGGWDIPLLDLPPPGVSPLPECSLGPAHLLIQPRGPQLLPWVRPRAGCEACVKRTKVGNLVPWTNLQTPPAQDFVSLQRQPKSSIQNLRVVILIYPKMLRIVP